MPRSSSRKREVIIRHITPAIRIAILLFVKGKYAEKSSLRTICFAALKKGEEQIAVQFSVIKLTPKTTV